MKQVPTRAALNGGAILITRQDTGYMWQVIDPQAARMPVSLHLMICPSRLPLVHGRGSEHSRSEAYLRG